MKKLIIAGVIIGIVIVAFVSKIKDPNLLEVKIASVKSGTVSKYLEEIGAVNSKEQRIVNSKGIGEIDKVNIEVGSTVQKGDILATINSEKINYEIKALNEQINSIRATYQEAVKPIDESRIQQAEANVNNAKLDLQEAERLLVNSQKLYANGTISYEEHKNAMNNVSIKQNLFVIAQQELNLLQTGVSQNVKEEFESQIAQLEYQKNILQTSKNDLIIIAPISGVITELFIKEGSYVQPGVNIFEIGNNDLLYIESEVLTSDISNITEGGKVEIEDEDLNISEIGNVEKIYPKAYSKISDLGIEQKRIKVDVKIPKNLNLKIGYEVDIKFLVEQVNDVLYIPNNCIFDLDNKKMVFIVENGLAKLREVKIGLEGDDYTEIKHGLNENDKVITSPEKDLEEGMSVKGIE